MGTKAKFINKRAVKKQVYEQIEQQVTRSVRKAVTAISDATRKEYVQTTLEVSGRWNATYTPLTKENNFRNENASYYQRAFEKRQALYENIKPIIRKPRFFVHRKSNIFYFEIIIQSLMGNDKGIPNNLWYWRDRGTNPTKQVHTSPIVSGNWGRILAGKTRGGIEAQNYSDAIALNLKDYIEKNIYIMGAEKLNVSHRLGDIKLVRHRISNKLPEPS